MTSFPHYTQLDQMDCGSTCLRMIAKYYGRSFSAQSLRERAQVGKEGGSLLGISAAAETIGFRTIGVKIPFKKLITEVAFPCIVHWNQNHFVVVYASKGTDNNWMSRIWGGRKAPESNEFQPEEGKNWFLPITPAMSMLVPEKRTRWPYRGEIYVADPAKGLLTYTVEEFCQHWLSARIDEQDEGVALLLEPTSAFYEQDEEATSEYSFGRVLSYLGQYKALVVQLLLGLAVSSGLQLVFPFLTQSVIDVGVNTRNLPFLYLVLGAQLMLIIGRLSIDFIRSWIMLHISARVNLSILSDFLIKLMRLPMSFFDSKQFGDIVQRVGDHSRIESFLTGSTISVMFSILNLMVLSIVLALFNLTIFGIFMVSSLLYVGWVILFLKQRRKFDFKRFDLASRNQSSLVQLIQGMQEIKLAGAERQMRWDWERLRVRLFRLQMKGLALSQYQQIGTLAINEGKNIFITFLAAQAVINGQISLGAMMAMMQIIGQMNGPIEQLIGFVQSLQDAKISLERLNEIHNLSDEEPQNQPKLDQLPASKTLQFKNASFTYVGAGNEPVLNNINLSMPEGKTTAIVGMSGSGKTTMLKLLLRFYEPTRGEIRVGDAALRNIGHGMWRSLCGSVMQDGFIFSDTIARNIAVGVERIDPRKLDHAVRVANLQEVIDSLPSGLHTKIGTEGSGVSQGQRQRILIARAVYKDPEYIFFDEATNALDSTNEAIILKNLDEFFRNRTVVIVAHRLSTVRHADQIVVLDKGYISEIGTHEQLLDQHGTYWQLVKNQLSI